MGSLGDGIGPDSSVGSGLGPYVDPGIGRTKCLARGQGWLGPGIGKG